MSNLSFRAVAVKEPLPEIPRRNEWTPLLRAASLTGAAAVAGAALSVIATKIFAAMLGPAEVAVLATLQQIRQAGITGATLNGQTALVQGASARSGPERRRFLRTALLLMGTATALVATLALAAPGWVALSSGLGAERAGLIRWMAVPVMLSSALVFLSAMLNARGEIGKLALVQMAAPAAMAVLAYPVTKAVHAGQEGALVGWLATAAGCAAALATVLAAPLWSGIFSRSRTDRWYRVRGRWWDREAARGFLTMSGSMLVGGAAASLVLLAARARILHQQGFAMAGQFDAAWAISMNHVSLVLASLQVYCLPTLARTSDRTVRNAHLVRMLTAAALAATAAVCLLAWLKPVVLALFYSDAFREAARYLRWTLVGDYLKVSSWVLSIPLLAAADMRAFLAADLSAYAVFAATAAVMGHFRGAAEGTAIAFVLMYAAHLALCGTIAWVRYEFRPGLPATLIWGGGLAAVMAVSAAKWSAR
jgi:O-antigen/teichoic acid export membrane protein